MSLTQTRETIVFLHIKLQIPLIRIFPDERFFYWKIRWSQAGFKHYRPPIRAEYRRNGGYIIRNLDLHGIYSAFVLQSVQDRQHGKVYPWRALKNRAAAMPLCFGLCVCVKRSIILCQQIETVLIHADSLGFGVLRKRLVQWFGNPQLELPRVFFFGNRLVRQWATFSCSRRREAD